MGLETSEQFPNGKNKEIFLLYKEIRGFVTRILALEKGVSHRVPDSKKDFSSLVNWLKSNGAKISNLKIESYGEQGHGLKATAKVKKGDTSIVIPRKVMMSAESAADSSIGNLVKNDILLSRMPNVALAVHLINESLDPESFWLPYIRTLPDHFTTVFYFDECDIVLLQKSAYFEEIIRIYVSIGRQYSYIFKLIQSSTDPGLNNLRCGFTYDRFRHAVSVVMTRQNMIPSKDGSTTLALIPYFDLANHARGQVSTDYDDDEDCSKCYAMRDFQTGDQFCIDYGRRSVAEQFLHNGFIADSQYNQVPLNIPFSKADPLQEVRSNLVTKFGLTGPHLLSSEKEIPISGKFLAFLRIYVMLEDKLKVLANQEETGNLASFEVYDKDTDQKVWKFLEGRCKLLLMMHQTTMEVDLAQVDLTDSRTKRLCLRFLACEKELLKSTIDYASSAL